MRCVYCGSNQSSVVDKREVVSTGEIRRRRECLKCHNRFTTYEKACNLDVYVIKRDGRREVFDRNKLKQGIEKALEKRPALDQTNLIVDKIVSKLVTKGTKQIESKSIGRAILLELKRIDPIAYLRFASVYRQFQGINDFTKELKHFRLEGSE